MSAVCDMNCFECPHPDCICDDFSQKEYISASEISRIAGVKRKKVAKNKKEYNKEYYLLNREYAIAYRKKYYEENKEQVREKARKYYAKHREERLAYAKKYGAENREKISEYNKQYRERKRKEKKNEGKQNFGA